MAVSASEVYLAHPECYDAEAARLIKDGGDLFGFPLGKVDLAYAFLSPAAMPRLLVKAAREMRPGTWLISNSFGSADWPPDRCIVLRDRRRTHLYLWRLPRQTRRAGSASEAIDQND